jgi:magnesium-transporting ATPase (P-type)
MSNTPQASDLFQDQRTPSYGMLKTLTVLTFIGCAIAYIGLCINIASWGNYEKQLAEAQQMEEQMSNNAIGAKLLQGSVEMVQKSHEHRYILAATALIFTTMCLIGAMRMRKLRKSGYPIYVIGELAPLAVSGILLGFNFFSGIIMALSAVFALLFVILYTTQRKYLVNE